MKRYIRSNRDASLRITSNTWNDFLRKIEELSPYTVDSAYRRRHRGDNWLKLIDHDGIEYDAEFTEYSDGSFELLGYNIHRAS